VLLGTAAYKSTNGGQAENGICRGVLPCDLPGNQRQMIFCGDADREEMGEGPVDASVSGTGVGQSECERAWEAVAS